MFSTCDAADTSVKLELIRSCEMGLRLASLSLLHVAFAELMSSLQVHQSVQGKWLHWSLVAPQP